MVKLSQPTWAVTIIRSARPTFVAFGSSQVLRNQSEIMVNTTVAEIAPSGRITQARSPLNLIDKSGQADISTNEIVALNR